MRLSQEILTHVINNHVRPANQAAHQQLILRAGPIHKELGYRGRTPAVCSVLGSINLQRKANIRLIDRQGPHNSAHTQSTLDTE